MTPRPDITSRMLGIFLVLKVIPRTNRNKHSSSASWIPASKKRDTER
jgi:hypothetical protein